MSDDLAAAVERLRRIASGANLCDVYETIEAQPLGELARLWDQDKEAVLDVTIALQRAKEK